MSLKNILSLKKYSFLKQINDSKIILTPLSHTIKQNIANQWIKSINRLPRIQLFVHPFVSQSDPMSRNQINSLKTILDNYKEYYRVWSEGSCEPIGVIHKFVCLRDHKIKTFFDKNKNDCLVFVLFCGKQESLFWFQKLQGMRFQWFKNHSKSPLLSKFSTEVNENNKKWFLSYKSEEFNDNLETIEYFFDGLTEKKFEINDCDVISCFIDLDNTLMAYLFDAFSLKTLSNGKTIKKMKLNSLLSPFKIAFTYRQNVVINQLIIELTKYLIESLKVFDIPVLPFSVNNPIPIESFDELGIPFTVILDNESTRNGVIALRFRDSDTEESLHVSKFQQSICLYLNVIHPSNIRNKN